MMRSLNKDNYLLIIEMEAMVNSTGKYEKIARIHLDPDPLILLIPHVKVSASPQYAPHLLVIMKVFRIEFLHHLLVIFQLLWHHFNRVFPSVVTQLADQVNLTPVVFWINLSKSY